MEIFYSVSAYAGRIYKSSLRRACPLLPSHQSCKAGTRHKAVFGCCGCFACFCSQASSPPHRRPHSRTNSKAQRCLAPSCRNLERPKGVCAEDKQKLTQNSFLTRQPPAVTVPHDACSIRRLWQRRSVLNCAFNLQMKEPEPPAPTIPALDVQKAVTKRDRDMRHHHHHSHTIAQHTSVPQVHC